MKRTLITLLCLGVFQSSFATIFIVTNTDDAGPGSLRQAVLDANASLIKDTIHFNIPGEAPHTITLIDDLPQMTRSIVIDGNTQPANGYVGENKKIRLVGDRGGWALVFGGQDSEVYGMHLTDFSSGFVFTQTGFICDGNVLEDLGDSGIKVYNVRGGGTVRNSFFGVLPGQDDCSGRIGAEGIYMLNSTQINVQDNVFLCCGVGVGLGGTSESVITGNYIGGTQNGCNGNVRIGIFVLGADNQIGGNTPGEENIISSAQTGIQINNFGTGSVRNMLNGNIMQCVSGDGILLGADANNNKPIPEILTADQTFVSGIAEPGDVIEIFRVPDNINIGCTPTLVVQGDLFYGSVTADLNGDWTLNGTFEGELTATASDPINGTSAYANAMATGEPYATAISSCAGIVLDWIDARIEAEKVGQIVRLYWEVNGADLVKNWAIERSVDNKNWKEISLGHSQNREIDPFENNSWDSQPLAGENYYRLAIWDIDGRKKYSNTASVKFSQEPISGIQVFPNPTTDLINIRPVGANAFLKGSMMKIFDPLGNLLLEQKLLNATTQSEVNLQHLPAGIYFLYVSSPYASVTKKIVKR